MLFLDFGYHHSIEKSLSLRQDNLAMPILTLTYIRTTYAGNPTSIFTHYFSKSTLSCCNQASVFDSTRTFSADPSTFYKHTVNYEFSIFQFFQIR